MTLDQYVRGLGQYHKVAFNYQFLMKAISFKRVNYKQCCCLIQIKEIDMNFLLTDYTQFGLQHTRKFGSCYKNVVWEVAHPQMFNLGTLSPVFSPGFVCEKNIILGRNIGCWFGGRRRELRALHYQLQFMPCLEHWNKESRQEINSIFHSLMHFDCF